MDFGAILTILIIYPDWLYLASLTQLAIFKHRYYRIKKL